MPDTPALDATTSETSPPPEAAPADEPANTGPGDDDEDQDDEDQDLRDSDDTGSDGHPDLAVDLVPYLPAARAARDELLEKGVTVSRDALAQRLGRNGTALRNTRVSELLAVLKAETGPVDGSRPKASV